MDLAVGDEFRSTRTGRRIQLIGRRLVPPWGPHKPEEWHVDYGNGHDAWYAHYIVETLVSSGQWEPLTRKGPAPGKGEPVCRQCGRREEYQPGPFTCWACRNGV